MLVLLGCLWLEFAVRVLGLSGVALLRDIAVIQVGQTVMALAGGFEGAGAGAGAGAGWGPAGAEASLFLLRTCLLCGPPFAYGVLAGLGMQAPVAEYVRNAVTAYQYRYSAAASAVLRRLDVGVAPVLLGVAVRVGSLLAAAAAAPAPRLLSLAQGALHLVLVDLLLFDLRSSRRPACPCAPCRGSSSCCCAAVLRHFSSACTSVTCAWPSGSSCPGAINGHAVRTRRYTVRSRLLLCLCVHKRLYCTCMLWGVLCVRVCVSLSPTIRASWACCWATVAHVRMACISVAPHTLQTGNPPCLESAGRPLSPLFVFKQKAQAGLLLTQVLLCRFG